MHACQTNNLIIMVVYKTWPGLRFGPAFTYLKPGPGHFFLSKKANKIRPSILARAGKVNKLNFTKLKILSYSQIFVNIHEYQREFLTNVNTNLKNFLEYEY